MKKLIASLFVFVAIVTNSFAQNVVIERPGLLTDLSTALIAVPAAAATGIVTGVVEAGRNLVCGSTTIVTTPAPRQVVVTSPSSIVVPSTTVTTTTTAPVYVGPSTVIQYPSTTQITTIYGNGTSVTVTRPASGYELGPNVVYPAAPGHRVGPSPLTNPYIHRPHGF